MDPLRSSDVSVTGKPAMGFDFLNVSLRHLTASLGDERSGVEENVIERPIGNLNLSMI